MDKELVADNIQLIKIRQRLLEEQQEVDILIPPKKDLPKLTYYQKNKEKIKAYKRKYYLKNKEKVREQKRQYFKKKRKKN